MVERCLDITLSYYQMYMEFLHAQDIGLMRGFLSEYYSS